MLRGRLDRIIEIKEKMMEDKERELEEEKLKLGAMDVEISKVRADIDDNYNKLGSNPLKGNDFSVITDYLEYLENKKCLLLRESAFIEERILLTRQELVELMQETKMLGKLRVKEMNALKKSANRREQKLLDGMALRGEDR